MLQALQDTVNQILTVGYHNGSDSLFHMSCHGLLEHGHPDIVFATQFAAQLVFYKLGEVARYRQLAWFHGAASHAHWQGARGYWFERLAHQVLANGGEHTVGEFSCSDSSLAGCSQPSEQKQMPVLLHCIAHFAPGMTQHLLVNLPSLMK